VDTAIADVNAAADELKKDVVAALDLLGKELDLLLGALLDALNAAIDAVGSFVQGVISVAKGLVQALDVATGLKELTERRPLSNTNEDYRNAVTALHHLIANREAARSRVGFLHAGIATQMLGRGDTTLDQLFTGRRLPMAPEGATGAARRLDRVLGFEPERGPAGKKGVVEFAEREYQFILDSIRSSLRASLRLQRLRYEGAGLEAHVDADFKKLMSDPVRLRAFIALRLRTTHAIGQSGR
jgi:hypothetical protein